MYVDLDLPVPARPARPLTLAVLAVTAAVTATILAVGGGVLAVFGRDLSVLLLPAPLAYAWMGCVLLARRPGHPMGPLLCLIGLADAFATGCYAYVRYALVHAPGSLPFSTAVLWLNNWAYAPATSLGAMVLLLVFPDGRLLSRRFRPSLWAALAFIPLAIAGFAFYPQNLGPLFHYRRNPYVIPRLDWLFETCAVLAIGCGVVAGAGAAASVTLRWRRADRVGRQQLKWLLATLPFTILSLIATLVFPGTWSLVLALPAGILMPIAIGIAVLRYRLYEIDILLNRAALYGTLTAGMAVVYLAVVVAAQSFRSVFGLRGSNLAVQIIATVLAAGALWPLH